VDEALAVRGREALRGLRGDVEHLALAGRAAGEHLAQRLALEQFGNDEGRAVVRADVVDRDDVGVVERGDGARFLLEAPQAVGILGEGFGQDLDRDVAAQACVTGAVDDAHPPGAEDAEDFVGAQPRSRSQGHRPRSFARIIAPAQELGCAHSVRTVSCALAALRGRPARLGALLACRMSQVQVRRKGPAPPHRHLQRTLSRSDTSNAVRTTSPLASTSGSRAAINESPLATCLDHGTGARARANDALAATAPRGCPCGRTPRRTGYCFFGTSLCSSCTRFMAS
jgi:hypothetical protein